MGSSPTQSESIVFLTLYSGTEIVFQELFRLINRYFLIGLIFCSGWLILSCRNLLSERTFTKGLAQPLAVVSSPLVRSRSLSPNCHPLFALSILCGTAVFDVEPLVVFAPSPSRSDQHRRFPCRVSFSRPRPTSFLIGVTQQPPK